MQILNSYFPQPDWFEKNYNFTLFTLLFLSILFIWALVLLLLFKVMSLYKKLNSDYQDYWFAPKWYQDPLTHLLLFFGKSSYSVDSVDSKNLYIIRDVKLFKAGFWTRLER